MSGESSPDPSLSRSAKELQAYQGLMEVGALINAIQDRERLLNELMRVARRVMHADACSLMLVDEESGDLISAVLQSSPGAMPGMRNESLRVPRGHGVSGWVHEHRVAQLIPDAYADPRFYKDADKHSGYRTRSILCAPLLADGQSLGVIQVLNPLDGEAFDETDLTLFRAYSDLAAAAISKLRALEVEKIQARLEQELDLAAEIQHSFLPSELPGSRLLTFASRYRPARHVGGDFFDCMAAGENRWFFVIGDVAGKGVPAALLMAKALSFLRLVFNETRSPAEVLSAWNNMMIGRSVQGLFVTASVGLVNALTGEVTLANAGHCSPLLLDANGALSTTPSRPSVPLAILPDHAYVQDTVVLPPGAGLVFYTDGLTESQNPEGKFLDEAGACALASQAENSELLSLLNAMIDGESRHRGPADPHDDLTLFAFRRCPA